MADEFSASTKRRTAGVTLVWAVHVTLADEVRPTEVIFTSEINACAYAASVSKDDDVLATSVVRFALDTLGARNGIAMFVRGTRQQVPYVSDCRTIFGGGCKPL